MVNPCYPCDWSMFLILSFLSCSSSLCFSCMMSLSHCLSLLLSSPLSPPLCLSRCWLRLDTYFIWSFIGPATLIIMVRYTYMHAHTHNTALHVQSRLAATCSCRNDMVTLRCLLIFPQGLPELHSSVSEGNFICQFNNSHSWINSQVGTYSNKLEIFGRTNRRL